MATTTPRPWTPTEERIGSAFIKWMSVANTWAFRLTGGWLGGKFRGGAPVCLVTMKGRKTGEPRTAPLLYLRDGRDIIIVASKGGMSKHPLWYLNLEADPHCEVEIGREKRSMTARRVTPEEKAALWPKLCAMYPDYADYQARTTRDIPVLRLTPA
jgi:deazaflavin-dependent oxidoreductase (nitroreductase family)